MDQLVKEHQAEKKIALVCADLFDHIAKSERQRADTMRSERACRAFRVDIRSASYFRCRCGHPKSAHAFSPLPEEQHFVSSAGITPKWTVNEDGDGDGDDNSSLGAMSSLSRDESRSLGAGLDGVDGNGEPIQMVALPCLDEFRQQFAARSQVGGFDAGRGCKAFRGRPSNFGGTTIPARGLSSSTTLFVITLLSQGFSLLQTCYHYFTFASDHRTDAFATHGGSCSSGGVWQRHSCDGPRCELRKTTDAAPLEHCR
jgi:hypothetical protein